MSQTVLITGASRGIGRAIATAFAKEGYNLVLTCKQNKELLINLATELENTYQIECSTFVGDMGSYKDVSYLFQLLQTNNPIITIDIVINNAGISHIGLLSDMSIEQWDQIIQTNLTSAFLCSKFAIPNMVANQDGKIINISSVWGNVGASMEVAYSTSKAGLNGFTKALAKELAPSNIQVNAISCGLIDTDMNKCFSDEEMASIINDIPANRAGNVDEVATLALQLATGHDYLNGQIINLDGAWI